MSLLSLRLALCLFMLGCFHAKEYSCDENFNVQKLLPGKPNCGNNECYCVDNTAKCVGNRTKANLPKLKDRIDQLYIECYGLTVLNQSSFANIEKLNLRKIYLRRNGISFISKDIFSKFSNLTVVEISDNAKINHTSLYIALGSIQKTLPLNLTLNDIGMKNVTDDTFRHLNKSNVIFLSLIDNRIDFLNLTSFQHLTSLQELRLNKNWINGTTGTGKMKRLHILDLGQNHLTKDVSFCMQNGSAYFPELKSLLLDNNQLGTMEERFTNNWDCLNKLQSLDLSKNEMKKVYISFFTNFVSLNDLHLGSNWINEVIPGKYPISLTKIDFRNNEIAVFPPFLCDYKSTLMYPNIQVLNFSRNYIQKIITNNWTCLPGIQILDFSKNDVRELKNNTFANYTSLTHLYLDNMIPWVKVEPAAFNSTSLQNLSIRFNWIDFTKQEALQIFKWCPNVKWIDISYNNFRDMNESSIVEILSPMTNLELIKAQRISLKTFPCLFLTMFKNLKYLDINRNLLGDIRFPDAFNNKSLNLSIKHISVAEGAINTIKQEAFPSSIMNALKELDVSDNEFACTCEMRWFRERVQNGYIGNVKLLNWPVKYVCRSPSRLVGTFFKDYEPDEECEHMKPVFIALISIGCSLLVFSVLFATAYWNRWYLQYYWYKVSRRRKDAKSRDFETQPILNKIQYDAYVVYSEEDGDFVHHSFRTLLETKLSYKLHIWKRNAKNGTLVDVILDAIYASKQTIVIVSDNLMKDQWCKFQVDVAIDRSIDLEQKCIMLVVLDDINFKSMSKSWCVLLTKNPTAYWCNEEDENDVRRKLFEQKIKLQFGKPLQDRFDSSVNSDM